MVAFSYVLFLLYLSQSIVKMLYFVVPTLQSYSLPYDMLLESMENAGIDFQQVITVYGMETVDEIVDDCQYNMSVRVRNNIYEYNAFIGITVLLNAGKVQETDSFFVLQDTSKVGKEFKTKTDWLWEQHKRNGVDISWAQNYGQCNIGIFSASACRTIYGKFKDVLTMDKKEAIMMEHNISGQSIKKLPVKQWFCQERSYEKGTECIYSDVPRVVLYFPSIDYYKYFFNCGSKMEGHPERP
jgi:hypothetical protein